MRLLKLLGKRHTPEAFVKILSNYYLGMTTPEPYPRLNQSMYQILMEMDKYDRNHQNIIWYIKRNLLGMPVEMRDFKKAVFAGLLMLEGFNVKFFKTNDEVYEVSKNVKERIEIGDLDNWIYLYATIFEGKHNVLGTVQEERQFLTNNRYITDVYVRDNDCVDYVDLLDFLKIVETYRWRNLK